MRMGMRKEMGKGSACGGGRGPEWLTSPTAVGSRAAAPPRLRNGDAGDDTMRRWRSSSLERGLGAARSWESCRE